jgi:outer membrane lipoprotein-sorting protein
VDFTPKNNDKRDMVSAIKLRIDRASWMPVAQVIEATATGHTMTVNYSNMARNLNLNPDLFKGTWPRGTKKEKINSCSALSSIHSSRPCGEAG